MSGAGADDRRLRTQSHCNNNNNGVGGPEKTCLTATSHEYINSAKLMDAENNNTISNSSAFVNNNEISVGNTAGSNTDGEAVVVPMSSMLTDLLFPIEEKSPEADSKTVSPR